MTGNEWLFWTFSAGTALTVAGGLVATRLRGDWLTSVPMAHAAAIVLIALFGWESLIYLPSTIQVYSIGVAGIPDPPNVEEYQAFIVASVAFVIASALAMYGILRLRPWGLALGVGVAATRLLTTVASAVNLFSLGLEPLGPAGLAWNVIDLLALRGVPAVAAIVLLLWPLMRRSTAEAPPIDAVDWSPEPSAEVSR